MEQMNILDLINEPTEKKDPITATYFEISEELARRNKEMMSFSDYVSESATKEYREVIDDLVEYANALIFDHPQTEADKIAKMQKAVDKYSRFYANYINKDNEIGTRCPSVLICGSGNFPTRKKQKQIDAWDSLHKTYISPSRVKWTLNSILRDSTIKSDDADAVTRLERKLATLEQEHKEHLASNKQLKKEEGNKLPWEFTRKWYFTDNETAEIRRLKQRLEQLKTQVGKEEKVVEYENFKVEYSHEDERIKFYFDGKPADEIREQLKHNGFHWSRSNSAWQRLWNNQAEYVTKSLIEKFKEFFNE